LLLIPGQAVRLRRGPHLVRALLFGDPLAERRALPVEDHRVDDPGQRLATDPFEAVAEVTAALAVQQVEVVAADVVPDERDAGGDDFGDGLGDLSDALLSGHAVLGRVLVGDAVNLDGSGLHRDARVEQPGAGVGGDAAADEGEGAGDEAGGVGVLVAGLEVEGCHALREPGSHSAPPVARSLPIRTTIAPICSSSPISFVTSAPNCRVVPSS